MHHTPTHCHCGADREGSDHCPECGCEEYESVCDYVTPIQRFAQVGGARSADEVSAYLPSNYEVYGHRFPEGPSGRIVILIRGKDEAGWTLDDYVIPRLASGLMGCKEVVSDETALDQLNLLLSADEWPGASGMEDVLEIVRRTGRVEIDNAPEWQSH
jgi:hypothetical protein